MRRGRRLDLRYKMIICFILNGVHFSKWKFIHVWYGIFFCLPWNTLGSGGTTGGKSQTDVLPPPLPSLIPRFQKIVNILPIFGQNFHALWTQFPNFSVFCVFFFFVFLVLPGLDCIQFRRDLVVYYFWQILVKIKLIWGVKSQNFRASKPNFFLASLPKKFSCPSPQKKLIRCANYPSFSGSVPHFGLSK